jgi:hypothetical protein
MEFPLSEKISINLLFPKFFKEIAPRPCDEKEGQI